MQQLSEYEKTISIPAFSIRYRIVGDATWMDAALIAAAGIFQYPLSDRR